MDPRTFEELRGIEANAVALGCTIDGLMENAGRAVAEEASRHLPPPPGRLAIISGTGNNGGDGCAAAHYLHQWGYMPELWILRPPSEIRSAPARRCYERLARETSTHTGVPPESALRGFPLLIDALLGAGQRGLLRPPYREAAAAMNGSGVPILSIDVPSGLGTPDAVRPRWTITFTAPKAEFAAGEVGELQVRDVGIPMEADRETGPGEFLAYPVPREGRSVRVLVVGGGPFAGAPALTGLAALRSGAERSTLLVPHPASDLVQGFSPDLVVHPLGTTRLRPQDVPSVLQTIEGSRTSALVVGMGAGRDPETVEFFRQLLERLRGTVPIVVDADALDAILAGGTPSEKAPILVTPNEGELHRLFGQVPLDPVARLDVLASHAARLGVSFLAKGKVDAIVSVRRRSVNRHHPAAATVGGVGDLVAGIAGTLLGSGVPVDAAGRLAAYWIGSAAERAFGQNGPGLLATDVLAAIPVVLLEGLRRVGASGS